MSHHVEPLYYSANLAPACVSTSLRYGPMMCLPSLVGWSRPRCRHRCHCRPPVPRTAPNRHAATGTPVHTTTANSRVRQDAGLNFLL